MTSDNVTKVDFDEVKSLCRRIIREGDLNELTPRKIRHIIEKKMGLSPGTLDQRGNKTQIKEIIRLAVDEATKEQDHTVRGEPELEEQGGLTESEGNNENEEKTLEKAQKRKVVDESEDGEAPTSPPLHSSTSSSVGNRDQDVNDDRSDVSSVIDIEPPKKKKRKATTEANDQGPSAPRKEKAVAKKSRGGKTAGKMSDKNAATIANLKSYINKCGVRKVWSKVLAGMGPSDQIRYLKKTLEDLGMVGRPTLEKCKKIKAKRELQAEIESIDTGNIIGGLDETKPSLRRKARAAVYRRASVVEDDDERSEKGVKESDEGGKDKDGDKHGDEKEEGEEEEEGTNESSDDEVVFDSETESDDYQSDPHSDVSEDDNNGRDRPKSKRSEDMSNSDND